MENYKSGFVTIVGRPNVGKSTLLNNIIGEKISIISKKPQTTRNKITGVLTGKDYQIVFMDTPGIHKPKNKLGKYMGKVIKNSLSEVDTILFVIEAPEGIKEEDLKILKSIKVINTPIILVINKIDLVTREYLLPIIEKYSKELEFYSIIPISALENDGVENITREIYKLLKNGPKYFPDDMITDQPERQIVSEIIREKTLSNLNEEVPHGIAIEIESMKQRDNGELVDVLATIYCEKESHKGIVIGKKGTMLKNIGTNARKDIELLLGSNVNLQLWVKVKKDWRNSDILIKNFGFK